MFFGRHPTRLNKLCCFFIYFRYAATFSVLSGLCQFLSNGLSKILLIETSTSIKEVPVFRCHMFDVLAKRICDASRSGFKRILCKLWNFARCRSCNGCAKALQEPTASHVWSAKRLRDRLMIFLKRLSLHSRNVFKPNLRVVVKYLRYLLVDFRQPISHWDSNVSPDIGFARNLLCQIVDEP